MKRPFRQLLRDLLLYVVIGLTIGVAAILYAIHVPQKDRIDIRWMGLIGITPITFWVPVSALRARWRSGRFWVTALCLLVVHLGSYIALLKNVEHLGLLWFVVLNPMEWAVLLAVLQWATENSPSVRRR